MAEHYVPLSDSQLHRAIRTCYAIGKADGREAITFHEGDGIPEPDLSGEWADSRTIRSLARDCGLSYDLLDDFDCQRIGDAYEDGFYSVVPLGSADTTTPRTEG
jgi:hypothetical protein